MAKKMRIRKLAVVLLVLSMLTGMLGGFSAFAADKTKEITITTNTDINPFLRVALYSSVFKTGGPFILALFGMGIRSGLCIFIIRQFFRNMPVELEEAAMIDGCGSFGNGV